MDKKLLRRSPEDVKERLAKRGKEFVDLVDGFNNDGRLRRIAQEKFDLAKTELNKISKEIGTLFIAGKKEEAEELKLKAEKWKEKSRKAEENLINLDRHELTLLLEMPNLPHNSIPEGGEENAVIVKEWGEPKQFSFEPLDHVDLCSNLALVNFEAGARLSGGGFPVMVGQGALLQRALINLMLDVHISRHGYTELRPPFIVRPHCAVGTGNLPKFGDEMYHVNVIGQPLPEGSEGPHFYLIPTAEMALCNYYREQVLRQPALPIKFCAYSPCWRVEGGSYGKEARGLTRLHQFEKVELVRLCDPETSFDELEELTVEAEYILELLGLPYKRKVLPTGDMAFGSAKTYDLEVHCPTQNAWREVSSISNTTDFQSRRANIRYKPDTKSKPVFPHMLNASALALPRLMIAVLETYQQADGTVLLPEPLHKHMNGVNTLVPGEGPPLV